MTRRIYRIPPLRINSTATTATCLMEELRGGTFFLKDRFFYLVLRRAHCSVAVCSIIILIIIILILIIVVTVLLHMKSQTNLVILGRFL